MTAKDVLDKLRKAVEATKQKGVTVIPIDNMLAWADAVEKDIQQPPAEPSSHAFELARYQSELTLHEEHYKARISWEQKLFDSVITYGAATIKATSLINGGAAVALLAFLGHVWKDASSGFVAQLSFSMAMFLAGVFFSSLACGASYATQWFYHRQFEQRKKGIVVFHWVSIALVLLSFAAFIVGGFVCYVAFMTMVAAS